VKLWLTKNPTMVNLTILKLRSSVWLLMILGWRRVGLRVVISRYLNSRIRVIVPLTFLNLFTRIMLLISLIDYLYYFYRSMNIEIEERFMN
jgi:hypothetical protein